MTTYQSRAASAYAAVNLESRASTAGGVDLVILLIEGALERVKLAKLSIQQHDINQKIKLINQALQIISEGLRAHLDVRSGGEIALNLDDLYAFCSVRLLHANSRNDIAALDEVTTVLTPLLDAWNSIRNGGQSAADMAGKTLSDVTRALKDAVPAVRRMYGASTYASFAAAGA